MNPDPNSDNAPPEWAVKAADLSCDAFWRHTAWVAPKELKQELAAIIARHAPTLPQGSKPQRVAVADSLTSLEWTRLRDWMKDPQRKPSALAFTAGATRDGASAFESAQPQRVATQGVTELVEAEIMALLRDCVVIDENYHLDVTTDFFARLAALSAPGVEEPIVQNLRELTVNQSFALGEKCTRIAELEEEVAHDNGVIDRLTVERDDLRAQLAALTALLQRIEQDLTGWIESSRHKSIGQIRGELKAELAQLRALSANATPTPSDTPAPGAGKQEGLGNDMTARESFFERHVRRLAEGYRRDSKGSGMRWKTWVADELDAILSEAPDSVLSESSPKSEAPAARAATDGADTKRIDWLEAQKQFRCCSILKMDGLRERTYFNFVGRNGNAGERDSIRAAIDAGILADKAQRPAAATAPADAGATPTTQERKV